MNILYISLILVVMLMFYEAFCLTPLLIFLLYSTLNNSRNESDDIAIDILQDEYEAMMRSLHDGPDA